MSSPDEKVAASISEEPEDAGNDAKKSEVNASTYTLNLYLHIQFCIVALYSIITCCFCN